jgi:hypothetical protein
VAAGADVVLEHFGIGHGRVTSPAPTDTLSQLIGNHHALVWNGWRYQNPHQS